MDILLTKEIAREPSKTVALFGTTTLLRLPLFVLGCAAVGLYAWLAGYEQETLQIILIIGVAQLIWQFANTCRASLEGLERMEFISYADIAGKALNTFGSLLLIALGYGVLEIAAVAIGMSLVYFLVAVIPLRRIQSVSLQFDRDLAKWMLKAGSPYLVVTAFLVMYVQMDVVVMSLLVEDEALGWYSAADRLFGTLLFVPTVFITVVFPVLSRMYTSDAEAMPNVMRRSFNLLLLLSVPLGLGVMAVSGQLVVLLFGEDFTNSGPILAVMGIVLLLMYQNILLGRFLVSMDREKVWTVVMGIAVVSTLILDIILVPWADGRFGNGAIGGAIAYVVTEGGMLVYGLWLVRKNFNRGNVTFALRTILAGAAMVAVVWPLRDALLPIPVVLGAVTYLLFILILRVIPAEDWQLVQSVLPKRLSFGNR